MAVAVKKLDLKAGDVVQIRERRYDVVSDRAGGVALEPVITKTVEDLRAQRGTDALSKEEFEELFGDLPTVDAN